MPTPEQVARQGIDKLLTAAGWFVCDAEQANILAHRGVAIREFQLKKGHGFADYMLYVDGKAAGVVEAKKGGTTLVGVEPQSARYTAGLPDALPAWRRPLAFAYESTGVETRFTNGLDAAPRSRNVFAFHRPETLADWLADVGLTRSVSAETSKVAEAAPDYAARGTTFLARMQHMPPLADQLWPPKPKAIENNRALTAREQTASPRPDGDRVRQDTVGYRAGVSASQVRRCPPDLVPRGPRQPRRPNAQGVPAVRLASGSIRSMYKPSAGKTP